MAYEWERYPRCDSAKVTTGSGWGIACVLFYFGAMICFVIAYIADNNLMVQSIAYTIDNQLMKHPIALGIIILIGLLTLFTCIKIIKGGMTSRCETCSYAWEPTKIED